MADVPRAALLFYPFTSPGTTSLDEAIHELEPGFVCKVAQPKYVLGVALTV